MKILRKITSSILAVVLLASVAVSVNPQVGYAADPSGTVRISGSTSVYPLVQALREGFKKKYPRVMISLVNITGSGSGIADAMKGTVDFGMSSRALTSSEKRSLDATEIAYDGVAIVVNKNNPLKEITNSQLFGIYTGKIDNWKEIAGSNSSLGTIATISRESGSGTRSCFEDVFKIDFKSALTSGYDKHDSNCSIQSTTGTMKTTVSATAGAIGYMSLGDVDNTVKVLKFNGVEASKQTVANRKYEFNRPFVFARNKGKNMSVQAKAFVDYILSAEGQAIVDKMGFVSLPKKIVDVTSITLNKTVVTLKKGNNTKLEAQILPSNATIQAVNYTSSDVKVATVHPTTGLITTIGAGTCYITATSESNNKTFKCKVVVAK